MRRLILYLTASFLVAAAGTSSALMGAPGKGVDDPCDAFKMIIVKPSKDVDYKLILIPVPKELDRAMVMNPCPAAPSLQSSTTIVPMNEEDKSFKVPPFKIKNKYNP